MRAIRRVWRCTAPSGALKATAGRDERRRNSLPGVVRSRGGGGGGPHEVDGVTAVRYVRGSPDEGMDVSQGGEASA